MHEVNIIKPVNPGWRINPKADPQQKQQQRRDPTPPPEAREDEQDDDGQPHVDDYA